MILFDKFWHFNILEASITGVSFYSSSLEEFRIMGNAVFDGYESGWLKPYVNKEFAIEKVHKVRKKFFKLNFYNKFILFFFKAHHEIIHAKGAKGKLVVKLC